MDDINNDPTETPANQAADGVQVPRTAITVEHVDLDCPQYGETVRWPVSSTNGVYAMPHLHCETCFNGGVELRRVD